MKNQVIIPIEMTARELEAKVVLASELSKKGFRVFLAEKHVAMNYARLSSGIVFLSIWGAHEKFGKFYKELQAIGNKVVAQDEEAFVTMGHDAYTKSRLNSRSLEFVDLFLCLGDWDRTLIESLQIGVEAKTVGNPRVDLLVTKKASLVEKGSTILFVSPFGFANHFNGGREYLNQLKQSKVLKDPETIALYERYIDYQSASMEGFLEFALCVAEDFSDQKIVYRCHPAENIKKIEEFFLNTPVEVSLGTSLMADLSQSNIVVHNFCTVGIEAQLLGKKTLAFTPISFGAEDEDYVYKNSVIAKNSKQGAEALSRLLAAEEPVEKFDGGERIFVPPETSSTRISDELWGAFGAEPKAAALGQINLKFLLFLLKRRLKGIVRGRNSYFLSRQKGMDLTSIRQILKEQQRDGNFQARTAYFGEMFEIRAN